MGPTCHDRTALQILEDTVVLSSAQAANPRWLAPEVLEGQPATLESVSVGA